MFNDQSIIIIINSGSDTECVIYFLNVFLSFTDVDPQEELRVEVFLHSYGCQDPVTQHLSNKLELYDPALVSSAHEPPELQCPTLATYREFSSGTIHTKLASVKKHCLYC